MVHKFVKIEHGFLFQADQVKYFFQMKTCPGERLECPLLHQSNGQFDIKM